MADADRYDGFSLLRGGTGGRFGTCPGGRGAGGRRSMKEEEEEGGAGGRRSMKEEEEEGGAVTGGGEILSCRCKE